MKEDEYLTRDTWNIQGEPAKESPERAALRKLCHVLRSRNFGGKPRDVQISYDEACMVLGPWRGATARSQARAEYMLVKRRDKFEKWALDSGFKRLNGVYVDPQIENLWEAFQEGAE